MLSKTRTTIIALVAAFSFAGASLVPTVASAQAMGTNGSGMELSQPTTIASEGKKRKYIIVPIIQADGVSVVFYAIPLL